MKTLIAAAFAATLLVPAEVAGAEPIVVEHPGVTQIDWAKNVASELQTKLRYPDVSTATAGAVSVQFRCGADGRAEDINVVRPSGAKAFDNEAMRVVSKLTRLGNGPGLHATGRMIRADIVFAEHESQVPALVRQLRDDNARLARLRAKQALPDLVIAVGTGLQG